MNKHICFICATILSSFIFTHVSAQSIQLSSLVGQVPTNNDVIVFDSIDLIDDIDFTIGTSNIIINKKGNYFIIAAPQIGYDGYIWFHDYVFNCWMIKNGVPIINSNVQFNSGKSDKDVIVVQAIVEFDKDDVLQIGYSGNNSKIEAIFILGQPVVPSIIFSMFKI